VGPVEPSVVDRPRPWSAGAWRQLPWPTIGCHAAVAVGTLFVIRVVGAGWPSGFPTFFPDSSSFLAVAGRGPLTGRFWFDERPVGFPLLAWAVGGNVRLIVLVQTVLYVASFAALAAAVVTSLRSRLCRVTAVALITVVATQPRFALWNTHVLSESLTISLGILTLAGWWWWAARPSRPRLGLAALATVAWLVTRDSNVVPVVVVVVPALLGAARWGRRLTPDVRRALAVTAGSLLLVGAYVFVAQDVSERNRYPVMNNVGQRILPDEGMTEWFVERGMPLDERLRQLTGRSSFDEDRAMLTDDRLADFRDWAEGPGQRAQALSFVLRAGFWVDLMTDDSQLPAVLGTDFDSYDAFGVGDRLPQSWFGFSGPRSMVAAGVWMLAALAGIALGVVRYRLRPLAVVTGVGVLATVLDTYVSYAGDSVEFARHLVGPIARLTVLFALGIVLAVEYVMTRNEGDSGAPSAGVEHRPPRRSIAPYALTALVTTLVAAAIFGNELRAQNFDPQYMRVLIDRTLRYGGSFYENGIHNKGPLEPVVYLAAHWLGGSAGYWIAMSVLVAVAAVLVAAVIAGTARIAGAGWAVAVTVGAGMLFHLTLSEADYAGTLYARQLTVTLLAGAWAIAIVERCWSSPRRATASAIAIGVLLGLAVQTLLSTVIAASVVAGLAVTGAARRAGARRRQPWHRWPRTLLLIGAGGAVVLLAVPAYYAVRGSFNEFWSGWWTYAGFSNSATGRSLAGQLGLGWDQAYAYYRRFPLSFVVLVAFALTSSVLWREDTRRQRQIRVASGAWIVAAWIELALSQRYSSHYFSILAVPTWIAFALLAADGERLLRDRGRVTPSSAAVPLVGLLLLVYVSGATPLMDGVARASAFTSVDQLVASRRRGAPGPVHVEQAVLDLVTSSGDPMLAWTLAPWTYLEHDRVAATRFIWKSFLVGEVYLAGSGAQYVLPDTWEWFADDVDESEPLVYHEELTLPRDPATPFASYVEERFEPAYTGSVATVSIERSVLDRVRSGGAGRRPWTAETVPDGWTVASGLIGYEQSPGVVADGLTLDRGTCRRVDATVDRSVVSDPELEVLVLDELGNTLGRMRIAEGAATSSSDAVELDTQPWTWPAGTTSSPMAVVTGSESVALLLDGLVRAAVQLPGGHRPEVVLAGGATDLSLRDVTVAGTGPLGTSGCR
jgi:hypothetical protein